MRTEFARLLKILRKSYPDVDLTGVRGAYRVANEAHEGQVRLSGEPYIMHSIAVAKILSTGARMMMELSACISVLPRA